MVGPAPRCPPGGLGPTQEALLSVPPDKRRTINAWCMYDWANSAFMTTVTTALFPVFFRSIAINAGLPEHTATAYWGYTSSIALLLVALDVLILLAAGPSPTRSRAVVIHEAPELAQYRDHVAHQMHLLTRSGCFDPSDACLRYAAEMVTHAEEGLTIEGYRQYLVEGLNAMWKRRCLRDGGGCSEFTSSLPYHSHGR